MSEGELHARGQRNGRAHAFFRDAVERLESVVDGERAVLCGVCICVWKQSASDSNEHTSNVMVFVLLMHKQMLCFVVLCVGGLFAR